MSTRRRIHGLVALLVPVAAALILYHTIDLAGALRLLVDVGPWRFFVVFVLFMTGQVMSAFRWRLALRQITPTPPTIMTLLRLYLIGMFVNLGLPTMIGGDVARAELTRRHLGGRGDAYATILADRVVGLVAVILLAFVAVLFGGTAFTAEMRQPVLIVAAVTVVLLALLVPAVGRWDVEALRGRFSRFVDALLLLGRRPRFLALSLAIALAVQSVAVVLPVAFLAGALGMDVPLAMHFILVPVMVIVAQLPIAPGGIGVRETGFVLLYGGIGVPAEVAFSLGLSWSLVLVTFGLLGGVLLATGQDRARSEVR